MSETETITVRLPAKIRIEYEFTNPFKSEKETPTKFSIDVKIFVTKDEAEVLDKELLDVMIQALNMIFEAKKLEQSIETAKEIFDTDPI
jgi:hypothetical protein